MTQEEFMDKLWRRHDNFKFDVLSEAEEAQEEICVFAQQFRKWFQRTCQGIIDNPDLIAINQAKLRLLDHYYDLRAYVPKSHRYRVGEQGHTCIFHIFEHSYAALRLAEFNLVKPAIFLPEKPASPPRPEPPLIPPPPLFPDVGLDEPT